MAKGDIKKTTKKALEFDKKYHILTLVLMFMAAIGFLWAILEKESHKHDLEGANAEVHELKGRNKLLNKMADIDERILLKEDYEKALNDYKHFPDSINNDISERINKRVRHIEKITADNTEHNPKAEFFQKKMERKEKQCTATIDSLQKEIERLSKEK